MVKKNRTTIWRHINSGKLSIERDRDGLPLVDTSELIRVYGELKVSATPEVKELQHNATPDYSELVEVINALRKEQNEMKSQIKELTNRLTYTANNEEREEIERPESDVDWPKEVRSIADIALRNEIKSKYKR